MFDAILWSERNYLAVFGCSDDGAYVMFVDTFQFTGSETAYEEVAYEGRS
jgi:hypothetical protein